MSQINRATRRFRIVVIVLSCAVILFLFYLYQRLAFDRDVPAIASYTLSRKPSSTPNFSSTHPTYSKPTSQPQQQPNLVVGSSISPTVEAGKEVWRQQDLKNAGEENCRLPEVDPWDPSIRRFLDPNDTTPNFDQFSPLNCTPSFVEVTKLEGGRLTIRQQFVADVRRCRYRCLYPVNDVHYHKGKWLPIPMPVVAVEVGKNNSSQASTEARPQCDIFEVECKWKRKKKVKKEENDAPTSRVRQNGTPILPPFTLASKKIKDIPYYNLYSQIHVPGEGRRLPHSKLPDDGQPPRQEGGGYSVHVIIMDSLSQPQFLRSMPRTARLLLQHFDAVPFWHLNKVAQNSWPNGMALLYGVQAYDIYRSPLNELIPADVRWQEMCYKHVDNVESLVAYRFRDAGYRTMWAEDWSLGVLNWDCSGFNRTNINHYMKPFQLRVKNGDPGRFPIKFYSERCRERHSYLLDYLRQFIEAYHPHDHHPHQPIFSLQWSNHGHDNENSFYHLDDEYYKFFNSLGNQLRNSFVFFMGDHGLRYTDVRDTPQGAIEDFNPALFLLVPEELRRNNPNLMANLRENSHKLVTHYDVYATLVTIAKEASKWAEVGGRGEFTQWDVEGGYKERLHGSSLLHGGLKEPRNCASLRIPFPYCQCQYRMETLNGSDYLKLASTMAQEMADRMNALLVGQNVSEHCAQLAVSSQQAPLLEEFELSQFSSPSSHSIASASIRRVFRLTVQTTPGEGRFWDYATVEVDPVTRYNLSTIDFFSTYFTRLNAYGEQVKCVANGRLSRSFQPFCYCRNQTEEAPTPDVASSAQQYKGWWWGDTASETSTPVTTRNSKAESDEEGREIGPNLAMTN